MSRFFSRQGLRRSAANLADRIGEIAFANFSSRVSAQALRHGGRYEKRNRIYSDSCSASDRLRRHIHTGWHTGKGRGDAGSGSCAGSGRGRRRGAGGYGRRCTAAEGTEAASDTLVIYFSRTGEQYEVGVIDKGNTAIVAEMIAEQTGADMFEVLPADDHYPMTYDALTDVAKQEQNDKARPEYSDELPDLSGYSTIFIGSPVWWGDWPMIMYTMFEKNDFSGKTLIPFSTHEGSGLSGFDKKLEGACPDSTIGKGLAIRGYDAQNNQEEVRESVGSWLTELGF